MVSLQQFWSWLDGFTRLNLLDLSGNDLDSYDVNALQAMTSLRNLNLASNRPTHISVGLILDLDSLESLNIRDNGITSIPLNDRLQEISPHMVITLGDNRWNCNCRLTWLKQLIVRELAGESWNLERHEILHEITCNDPERLRGQLLKNVDESDLTC